MPCHFALPRWRRCVREEFDLQVALSTAASMRSGSRSDQAAGLRSIFRRPLLRVLPVMGAFNGCDTVIKRDSVKIFANPKARFTAIAIGCSPFADTIINNSFGQDAFTTYYWDLGDGTLDTTFTTGVLYHTYITGVVDTFTIQLIMVNRCARDTQTMDIIVSPSYIVEHITVNGSGLYGCAPHIVNFQNSSSGASTLYWDFGDGSPCSPSA